MPKLWIIVKMSGSIYIIIFVDLTSRFLFLVLNWTWRWAVDERWANACLACLWAHGDVAHTAMRERWPTTEGRTMEFVFIYFSNKFNMSKTISTHLSTDSPLNRMLEKLFVYSNRVCNNSIGFSFVPPIWSTLCTLWTSAKKYVYMCTKTTLSNFAFQHC